jgi:hypothetical protein
MRSQQRADFNRSVSRGGMACGPFQRGIQVWHINDGESGEKLLCLCVRTIVNLPLSVPDRDCRRCLRRLQSRPTDKDTGSLKRLTVGFPSRYGGFVIAAFEAILRDEAGLDRSVLSMTNTCRRIEPFS